MPASTSGVIGTRGLVSQLRGPASHVVVDVVDPGVGGATPVRQVITSVGGRTEKPSTQPAVLLCGGIVVAATVVSAGIVNMTPAFAALVFAGAVIIALRVGNKRARRTDENTRWASRTGQAFGAWEPATPTGRRRLLLDHRGLAVVDTGASRDPLAVLLWKHVDRLILVPGSERSTDPGIVAHRSDGQVAAFTTSFGLHEIMPALDDVGLSTDIEQAMAGTTSLRRGPLPMVSPAPPTDPWANVTASAAGAPTTTALLEPAPIPPPPEPVAPLTPRHADPDRATSLPLFGERTLSPTTDLFADPLPTPVLPGPEAFGGLTAPTAPAVDDDTSAGFGAPLTATPDPEPLGGHTTLPDTPSRHDDPFGLGAPLTATPDPEPFGLDAPLTDRSVTAAHHDDPFGVGASLTATPDPWPFADDAPAAAVTGAESTDLFGPRPAPAGDGSDLFAPRPSPVVPAVDQVPPAGPTMVPPRPASDGVDLFGPRPEGGASPVPAPPRPAGAPQTPAPPVTTMAPPPPPPPPPAPTPASGAVAPPPPAPPLGWGAPDDGGTAPTREVAPGELFELMGPRSAGAVDGDPLGGAPPERPLEAF